MFGSSPFSASPFSAVGAVVLTLSASVGSFTLTGNAATETTRRASASGAYVLTGNAVNVSIAKTLSAATGTFTFTGNAANVTRTATIGASAGAFTLTGGTVFGTRAIQANTGAFTLTGNAATISSARTLVSATGDFALTGQAATLQWQRLYALTASKGTFTLTGRNAGFARSQTLGTGAFALTGNASAASFARSISAAKGTFTLTGQAAGLFRAKILSAGTGAFVLSGKAATLSTTLSQLGQNFVNTLTSPVNFKGEVDANTVRTNDNLIAQAFNSHDTNSSIHVQSGLYRYLPTDPMVGAIYTATDKDTTYFWTGNAWDPIWSGRRYGAWQDSTTQTTSGANTATVITFDTTDIPDGVTLVDSSKMTATYPGVYNLQYSAQFVNTDSQLQDASIWLRKNGTDVTGSNSQFSIPNKHGSVDGHTIAALNYYISMNANDYVQLYWAATSTLVSLKASTASSPYPSTASVIATMAKV